MLTFSGPRVLQPCPATCTLSSLSYRLSSRRSWKQIPTLGEYYHWSAFHHRSHAVSEGRVTPACRWPSALCWGVTGPGSPTCPAWAVNISLGIYSDCVGVWRRWQLVIGWATDVQWSGTILVSVCVHTTWSLCCSVSSSGKEVFQRCTYTHGTMGEVDSSSLWCTRL